MNSYFVNISDEYLKNKEDNRRKQRRNDSIDYRADKNVLNSYKERYRYSQELKQGLHRQPQKKKRKHKVSQHRKEQFSDNLVQSESSDDELGHVIPTIEHIRLAGTTRRKLLERRISLLKERDQHTNVESRFSDRERKLLSGHHPSSSHSSYHTRMLHTATILENEMANDSEYGANFRGFPNDQKLTRTYRNAALNRAERLLHERKRLEAGSSSEADAEDSPRVLPKQLQQQQQQQQRLARPSTYVARRSRSRSVSSEREYVRVPEVIDPHDNDTDLPIIDLENEERVSNHKLRVPSNNRRLRSSGGSEKIFSDNRSPPPLSRNEIKLHGNEAGARIFSRGGRLDFSRVRVSSSNSKVRNYLKSAAQVSLK